MRENIGRVPPIDPRPSGAFCDNLGATGRISIEWVLECEPAHSTGTYVGLLRAVLMNGDGIIRVVW